MHVLFVHRNFPAQFGHVARHLTQHHQYRCTFVSEKRNGMVGGIECLQFEQKGGAVAANNYCSRTFENQMWASQAIMECLQRRPDIQPDLIVAHTGFATAIHLRELYDCPIVNYFEYFYRTVDSDIDFRKDLPSCNAMDRVRARARNAALLLDLENCDAGYAPTKWQRSRLPQFAQSKISTIFDGIETDLWFPNRHNPGQLPAECHVAAETKVVTYVSRGLEAMRGFDIFMRAANQLCRRRADVVVWVVGEDRVAYGGDQRFTNGMSFKDWVLSQDDYDLERIRFLGRVSPPVLASIFNRSNVHVYLTAPFVLSWSLMNALACATPVVASNTAPVQEMIRQNENGLLVDFFDVEEIVDATLRVLEEPEQAAQRGCAAADMIRRSYSVNACLPKMMDLFERVVQGREE